MVQPADFRNGDDGAGAGSLNGSRLGWVSLPKIPSVIIYAAIRRS